MTSFEKFKNFLELFTIHNIITKQNIMFYKFGSDVTIDNYRNHFCKAGYLKIVKRGTYQLVKKIPQNITCRQLRNEAYPHII